MHILLCLLHILFLVLDIHIEPVFAVVKEAVSEYVKRKYACGSLWTSPDPGPGFCGLLISFHTFSLACLHALERPTSFSTHSLQSHTVQSSPIHLGWGQRTVGSCNSPPKLFYENRTHNGIYIMAASKLFINYPLHLPSPFCQWR